MAEILLVSVDVLSVFLIVCINGIHCVFSFFLIDVHKNIYCAFF